MMQREHIVLRKEIAVRKAGMQTVRKAESIRRSDRQLIREILDRRHQVSVILS
jgi:hypothetical protein